MASASSAARSSSRSVDSTRSPATRTSRLKLRANALRASALPSAGRVAVIQIPRPGRRLFRSGTTEPSGATTNRIMSATGVTSPVAAQSRSLPGAIRRGPRSSPSSSPSSCGCVCMPRCVHSLCFSLRLACLSGSFGSWRRRQILFLDPAGLDAGLHDQGLGLFLAEIEVAENAGVLHGLAVLTLAPADQVVSDTASQILDRLDAILAHRHEHLGGGTGNLFQGILNAEILALAVELGLLLVEELARARLQLLRGFLVEALDAGELLV